MIVSGTARVVTGSRPPRDAPAAAALSRLEGAGVPVIECGYGPGDQVYGQGDPDGGLHFVRVGGAGLAPGFS